MISYELAKELKDAGYEFKVTDWDPLDHVRAAFFLDEPYGRGYIPPTLPELIESCGDDFVELWKRGDDGWSCMLEQGTLISQVWGKTPEEAVAKLWLALQDNK